MPNGAEVGYSLTARILHWVTAALVLGMIPAGIVIANFELPVLYDLHKSVGPLLLLIVIVRLLYRFKNPPPPLPDDLLPIQKLAAHVTHWALYALVIAQCLVGWIGTSAYPAPVPFFGLFNLPPIWWEDRALSERLFVLHLWIGIALVVVIGMHVGAALFHHFIRKDRILMRMVSG
jgi:cytochrome b561